MTIWARMTAAVAAVGISAVLAAPAVNAADITILSSRNVQPEMDAVIPPFERSSGHKVSISYPPNPDLFKRFEEGARADMVILYTETMDRLLKTSKISVGSRFDILQSGIGVVVRVGSPKPDVSSVEALKKALPGAKSIAFSQGPTGAYMATVVQRLGLAEQLKAKTIVTDSGIGAVGKAVASGEAEIGIHGTYELLSVAGIDFVGPVPTELQ